METIEKKHTQSTRRLMGLTQHKYSVHISEGALPAFFFFMYGISFYDKTDPWYRFECRRLNPRQGCLPLGNVPVDDTLG
jgi:hypothetical protein